MAAPLTSVGSVHLTQVEYSWTGKTLVYLGTGGTQDASHPHVGYVWMSTDDGDTWTDVTGDIVTASFGALMRVPQTLLHCHAPTRGPPLQPYVFALQVLRNGSRGPSISAAQARAS